MGYGLGRVILALALGAAAGVSAQTSLDIDRKVTDEPRIARRTDLQKAVVPKGAVAIDKAKQVTSAPAELRVPLALQATDNEEDVKSMRVVEGHGKIAFHGGSPVLEQKQSGTTVLSSGLAKSIAETSTITIDKKTGLPWMVVDVKHAPSGGVAPSHAPPTVRTGRPFLLLSRAVQWVPAAKRYVAELIVGLDPEEGSMPGALEEMLEDGTPLVLRITVAPVHLTQVADEQAVDELRAYEAKQGREADAAQSLSEGERG